MNTLILREIMFSMEVYKYVPNNIYQVLTYMLKIKTSKALRISSNPAYGDSTSVSN